MSAHLCPPHVDGGSVRRWGAAAHTAPCLRPQLAAGVLFNGAGSLLECECRSGRPMSAGDKRPILSQCGSDLPAADANQQGGKRSSSADDATRGRSRTKSCSSHASRRRLNFGPFCGACTRHDGSHDWRPLLPPESCLRHTLEQLSVWRLN